MKILDKCRGKNSRISKQKFAIYREKCQILMRLFEKNLSQTWKHFECKAHFLRNKLYLYVDSTLLQYMDNWIWDMYEYSYEYVTDVLHAQPALWAERLKLRPCDAYITKQPLAFARSV